MKALLFILIFCNYGFSQSSDFMANWDSVGYEIIYDLGNYYDYTNKSRVDTVRGLIVHVVPVMGEVYRPELDTTNIINGGWVADAIYYIAVVHEGIRIDTITSYFGQVPCPENRFGCLVYHTGWTDVRTGFRYESDGNAIETKNVIHFIPQ